MPHSKDNQGFTLIELSIVLVIIGLIVGGVLVGRDLINSAAERAQITQIEKFNSAVNTFRGKYGALPGDMTPSIASTFGFAARGSYAGEGDGNGIIEGITANALNSNDGDYESAGETAMFWSDLTYANGMNLNLIEGTFNQASSTVLPSSDISGTALPGYLPVGKLGGGNYINVWSYAGVNYYGLAGTNVLRANSSINSSPSITVKQAYDIDKKVDDGYPQSGTVQAIYAIWLGGGPLYEWVAASGYGASPGASAAATTSTCYDNGANTSNPMNYSLSISNGSYVNCVLSFKFQ